MEWLHSTPARRAEMELHPEALELIDGEGSALVGNFPIVTVMRAAASTASTQKHGPASDDRPHGPNILDRVVRHGEDIR
jgi:hypothetical protein